VGYPNNTTISLREEAVAATRVAVDRLIVNPLADRRKGVCSLVATSPSVPTRYTYVCPGLFGPKPSGARFACITEEGVERYAIGAVLVKLRPGVRQHSRHSNFSRACMTSTLHSAHIQNPDHTTFSIHHSCPTYHNFLSERPTPHLYLQSATTIQIPA
jgi:hypothetical protein